MAAYGLALILGAGSFVTLFVRKRHIDHAIDDFVSTPKAVPPGLGITRIGKEYDRLFD